MVLQCADCKKSHFNSQQGLTAHRKRCTVKDDQVLSRDRQITAALVTAFKKNKTRSRRKGPKHDGAPHPNQRIESGAGASLTLTPTTVDGPPPQAVPDPVPEPEGSTSRSRSGRLRTFPTRYKDFLPAQMIPLSHAPQPAPRHHSEPPSDDATPFVPPLEPESTTFTTTVDDSGLFRVYPIKPTCDPDSIIGLEDVCESHLFALNSSCASQSDNDPLLANGILPQTQDQAFYAPFLSPSIYRLMSWFVSVSRTVSIAALDSLVADVINAHDFDPLDFVGFSAAKESKRLDEDQGASEVSPGADTFSASHGWNESSVPLALPCERQNLMNESRAPTYPVSGLFHRDVVDIVSTAFQDPEVFPTLHLTPYKEFKELEEGEPPERVYGEMYSSDAFFDAWETVQSQGHMTGDSLERVMVALMLWSDSTCLTNFGSASLWPVYLSLGNQSKYIRSKPSTFSHHHLAYLPSVS